MHLPPLAACRRDNRRERLRGRRMPPLTLLYHGGSEGSKPGAAATTLSRSLGVDGPTRRPYTRLESGACRGPRLVL